MGVEYIEDNVKNSGINLNQLVTSFDAQNELLDNVIDNELLNTELYSEEYLALDSHYNDKFTGATTIADDKDNLFSLVDETGQSQQNMINNFTDVDISNISKSYNYSADMFRNQQAMNAYTEHKLNRFKQRNKHLLTDLDNKFRQKEIYTYYYKKNRAQTAILYHIIIATVLLVILKYLNKNFRFILNDTLFVLLLGSVLAVAAIKIIGQLIEIFFRNNINYDEYDFSFGSYKDGELQTDPAGSDALDDEMCSEEIRRYKGALS